MGANNDVKEYLDYYLSASSAGSGFAVMLNGAWGSGKTHFIKDYFKNRSVEAAGASSGTPNHLYASLYGVSSVSEIANQFFAQVHPTLASKPARLLGLMVSQLANAACGVGLPSGDEGASIIQDMLLKLDGRTLIFDDLERCAMPIVDVMGFINSHVEHEELKVIVVACEDEIPDDQKEAYLSRKEKLVGKTLQVSTDPEAVLDSFLRHLADPIIKKAIDQSRGALLRTFASAKPNFRSLRSVLFDFKRLIDCSDKRLKDNPKAMTHLLLYVLATGLEHRSRKLRGEQLAHLSGLGSIALSPGRKDASGETTPIDRLRATYQEVDWDDPIVPPADLAKFFETGIVDTASINDHLARHPLVVGYTQTPAWRQLWSWYDLPLGQYKEARQRLLEALQGHGLTHPGEILHAAGIILEISDYGDHLLDGDDIVTFFKNYALQVQQLKSLKPDRSVFDGTAGAYAGLGYRASGVPKFESICEAVRSATNASFANHMRHEASTYIERITNDPGAYASLHKHGLEGRNYADAPFLHHIKAEDFARIIIRDSWLDARLLANLRARYEFEQHNHLLADEYVWLRSLRSCLETSAAGARPPHRRLLEEGIKHYFDSIEDALPKDDSDTLDEEV